MNDALIAGLLVLSLFLILGSGVWIGLTLSGVAWIGMQLFTARPAGRHGRDHLGGIIELDTYCTAALYFDGRDSVSHSSI
jgi:hypothetical protein